MSISRRDWYPGLMERTKRLLTNYLPHLDLVLELADARAPRATRWPSLDAMLGRVPRLLLLNKSDLADPAATRRWLDHFHKGGQEAQGRPQDPSGLAALAAIAVSAGGAAGTGREANTVRSAIKAVRAEGLRSAQKVAVVGVPNVGKSALINLVAGRRRAPSGAKPGLTRGQQWVVVTPDLWILDLPGVLPPSPRDNREIASLALTGTLPEGAYDVLEVGLEFIGLVLETLGCEALAGMLDLGPGDRPPRAAAAGGVADATFWLSAFARRRGLLGPSGEPQIAQGAQILIADFRRGRMGRLTLEQPEKPGQPEQRDDGQV